MNTLSDLLVILEVEHSFMRWQIAILILLLLIALGLMWGQRRKLGVMRDYLAREDQERRRAQDKAEDELERSRADHARELQEQRARHEQALEEAKARHRQEIDEKVEHYAQISGRLGHHNEQLKQTLARQEKTGQQEKAAVNQLRASHARQAAALDYYATFLARFDHEIGGRLREIRSYLTSRSSAEDKEAARCLSHLAFAESSVKLNLLPVDWMPPFIRDARERADSFVLQANMADYVRRLRDSQRQVRLNNHAGPPMYVQGNWHHLEVAIQNLINNALKHGSSELVDIDVHPDHKHPDWAVIQISNGGAHIPQDEFEKLLKLGTTNDPEGRGIGLYMVEQVVKGFDGEIRCVPLDRIVNHDPGEQPGVRISVRLPIVPPES
ncbi:MAG: hypothetical protein KDK91_10480 [Gammaproteobacteria bacterium]|nr:hypothetical protein [Gammaproteobacteria bacterium]